MGLQVFDSLEDAVRGLFGESTGISGSSYVGGGDINDASCLILSNGNKVFVKTNSLQNAGFFDAEETGLEAIASTGTVNTPKLLCKGVDNVKARSFLMMEMVEPSKRVRDYYEVFGRQLAEMHLADTGKFVSGGSFGFTGDNYIGATKQINTPCDSWIEFFTKYRLEPQFKMAERYFSDDFLRSVTRLLDRLDSLLVEPKAPSLLHGDLWSGNSMTGSDGRAMLIDPACYVGHPEADIAMTELFGRLPDDFYRAYNEVNTLQSGYTDRREIYNLYHLLNHLNLFGSGYLSSVMQIVRRYT